MKNPLNWLLFGIVLGVALWFLRGTIEEYLLNARNAQG